MSVTRHDISFFLSSTCLLSILDDTFMIINNSVTVEIVLLIVPIEIHVIYLPYLIQLLSYSIALSIVVELDQD
jgi:hypothetical protein